VIKKQHKEISALKDEIRVLKEKLALLKGDAPVLPIVKTEVVIVPESVPQTLPPSLQDSDSSLIPPHVQAMLQQRAKFLPASDNAESGTVNFFLPPTNDMRNTRKFWASA
jgi:hypothetical protein